MVSHSRRHGRRDHRSANGERGARRRAETGEFVRSTLGPGGSNRTTSGTMPRGLLPRSSHQQRSPGWDRSTAAMDAAPIPNLAYYLVVNVLWIRSCIWQKGKASPSRRWLDSNPTSVELEPGCPAPLDDTPSSDRLFGCSVVDQVQECKRAAPCRKRLLNDLDVCKSSLCR